MASPGQWHRYLRWAAEQLAVEPVLAEVGGIDLADGRWRLVARGTPTGEPLQLGCNGLVLTGPGTPLRLPGQPDRHPRILDGRSLWTAGAVQRRERLAFDWVVVAVGFDPLWFVPLLGRGARDALAEAVGGPPGQPPARPAVERAIGHDLAVTGLRPRLHLPTLAGLAQGPGFPNLSCLGLPAGRSAGKPRGAAGRFRPRAPGRFFRLVG